MKITANNASENHYRYCIIGTGPIAITAALELERRHPEKKILLIEFGSGKLQGRNKLDDSIQIRNPVNHHEPYECTNKGLGGSSATWGGRCVMFDEIDFLKREIVGDECTWDLSILDEARQHIPEVSRIFECGEGPFDLKDDPERKDGRIAENFTPGPVTDTVVERWSMPTRFGERYGDHIIGSETIDYVDDCMARTFSKPDEEGRISTLQVEIGGSGECFEFHAENFVIAAGTQESTRLLLKNPQLFTAVGGKPEALGRYYQGHVSGKIASVVFHGDPSRTEYGFIQEKDGTYVRRRFQFPAETLRTENLLNTAIWLDNPLYYDPAHRSGVMSLMYLAMMMPVLGPKLAPPAIRHSVTKGRLHKIPQHLRNILMGLPQSITTPLVTFYKRYCLKRKLPGVFLKSPENKYALHFHAEQIPDESNRMQLGPDGELLEIHYELLDDDVDSVIRCHQLLDRWLRETDCGHLEYWFDQEKLADEIRRMSKDGIHQSGTTRIADTVETGVVDRDLKVFGTENLYVCSCSVLPTSGQANPTYFTGLLAARLAEHLSIR